MEREKRTPQNAELSPVELAAEVGEALPEKAAMSTLNLSGIDATTGTVEAVSDGVTNTAAATGDGGTDAAATACAWR